ncbi:hypothetical protein L249_3235 [Ophiocordyceps polyrhachis-furcata BCC 54312]|uniref:Uncharacterized protein n=1 Tax=Ophiocordyceps polyrhachis-furcata BCC 54312 TaxID=1330021 RepID=A0A367LMV7_9HYPO|nr:hypothetical protein L249_3235 [Ophiocordyceps polyrhachis-furcata BCC 54312]
MHLGRVLVCFVLPWLGTAKSLLHARSPPKPKPIQGSPVGDPRLMYIVGPVPASTAFSIGIHGSYSLEHRVVEWGSYEMVAIVPGRYHVMAHTNPELAIQGWARTWARRRHRRFTSVQIYAVSLTEDDRIFSRSNNDTILYSTYWSPCEARAWPPRFVHFFASLPQITDYALLADRNVVDTIFSRLSWRARRFASLEHLGSLVPVLNAPVGSTVCHCQTNFHLTQQLNEMMSMERQIINSLYTETGELLRDAYCDHLLSRDDYDRCVQMAQDVVRGRFGIQHGGAGVPLEAMNHQSMMAHRPMTLGANPLANVPPLLPAPEANFPLGMVHPSAQIPPPPALPEMNPQVPPPIQRAPNPYARPAFHVEPPVRMDPTAPMMSDPEPIPGPSYQEHPPRPYPPAAEVPLQFPVPNPPPEPPLPAPGLSQRRLENELQEFACQETLTEGDIFQGVWDALRPFVGMNVELLQQHFPNLDAASLHILSQGSCSRFDNHYLHKRSIEEEESSESTANATSCKDLAFSIAGKASGFSPMMEAQLLKPTLDGLEETENCMQLKSLHVRIELSSDVIYGWEGAGTNDDIYIEVGNQTILLLNSPWRGSVADKPVDLVKAFGSQPVSFDKFTTFSLFPRRSETMGPGGDPFKLKGLIFTARCESDPHREVIVDKYSSVNKDIYRLRWPSKYDGRIAVKDWHYSPFDTKAQTLAVSPPGRRDFCSHLKALQVRLTLDGLWQSWFSGGTVDDVYLSIGMENQPGKGTILLAQSPSAGQEFTTDVDLVKFFGRKTVPVAAVLSYVDIYATTGSGQSVNYTDGWQIKSIVFDGQCSDSNNTVRASIDFPDGKWVERQAGKEWGLVYTHDKIGLQRWFRVN